MLIKYIVLYLKYNYNEVIIKTNKMSNTKTELTDREKVINFLIKEKGTNIHRIIRRCELKEKRANSIINDLYDRGFISKKMEQQGDVWNTSWYSEILTYIG